MACPVQDVFVSECTTYIMEIPGIKNVNIGLDSRKGQAANYYAGHENASENLKHVSNIICISSGKGGVGKSTMCVNIAYTLSNLGAKVGIVDCDVYGPSLPKLIDVGDIEGVFFKTSTMNPDESVTNTEQFQKAGGVIVPLEYRG